MHNQPLWVGGTHVTDFKFHTVGVCKEDRIVLIAISRMSAIFSWWVKDLPTNPDYRFADSPNRLFTVCMESNVMRPGFITVVPAISTRTARWSALNAEHAAIFMF